MKKRIISIISCIVMIFSILSLASCGSKTIDSERYSVSLPSGYSMSSTYSDDETQIYEKSIFSGNIITVTYWSYDEVAELCSSKSISNPTEEQIQKVISDTFISGAGAVLPHKRAVTLGAYSLVEYDDVYDSTAAIYVFCGENGVWSIDFSIEEDEYDRFKEGIPEILDSFKEK